MMAFRRSTTIDGSDMAGPRPTPNQVQFPLACRRSTIDGCHPEGFVVSTPATRRIRALCGTAGLVYVGANPVIKKTTKMLRKRPSFAKKKEKAIPKRSSKANLKVKPRSPRRPISKDTTNAPPPRRRRSNIFLKGGLVDPNADLEQSLALSPVMTRSKSRGKLQASMSLNAPRRPQRKASFADMQLDDASLHTNSSPFSSLAPPPLAGWSSMPNEEPQPIIMTRSKSKLTMMAPPAMPQRKESQPNINNSAPRAPCRKESVPQDIHMAAPPVMPQRKESHPTLANKPQLKRYVSMPPPAMPQRKKSRSSLDTPQLKKYVSMPPPVMPQRKESHSSLDKPQLKKYVSFSHLEWDKLTFSPLSDAAPPAVPVRKLSANAFAA